MGVPLFLATLAVVFCGGGADYPTECRFGQPPCMSLALHKQHCASTATFRFYLDPPSPIYDTPAGEALYEALASHPARTADVSQACVVFPSVDTTGAAGLSASSPQSLSEDQVASPTWHGGVDHVVFHFGDYELEAEVGMAMVAASSFADRLDDAEQVVHYGKPPGTVLSNFAPARPGYDLWMPLPFYRCGHEPDFHLQRYAGKVPPPFQNRRLLLSFKGARFDVPPTHPGDVRNHLHVMHNNRDVVISTYCTIDERDCLTNATRVGSTSHNQDYMDACVEDTARSKALSYDDLMAKSHFAVVVPGEGTHSYRLFEAMAMGTIPVFIGENSLPFGELLDWEAMAVVEPDTSTASLRRLPAKLRAIPPATRWRMQQLCLEAFHTHLSSLDKHVDTLLRVLVNRFADVLHRPKAVLPPADAVTLYHLVPEHSSPHLSPWTEPPLVVNATTGALEAIARLHGVQTQLLQTADTRSLELAIPISYALALRYMGLGRAASFYGAATVASLLRKWHQSAFGEEATEQYLLKQGIGRRAVIDALSASATAVTSGWQAGPPPLKGQPPMAGDIALVTWCDPAKPGVAHVARRVTQHYADANGLEYTHDSPRWDPAVLRGHDWVAVVDCEALLLNVGVPLSKVLTSSLEAADNAAHVVIAGVGNPALVFVSNTPAGVEFFGKMATLLDALAGYSRAPRLATHLLAMADRSRIMPAPSLWTGNAPEELTPEGQHFHRAHDLVARFNGCLKVLSTQEECTALMRKYAAASGVPGFGGLGWAANLAALGGALLCGAGVVWFRRSHRPRPRAVLKPKLK